MAKDGAARLHAHRAGGQYVVHLADRQNLPAHQARRDRPAEDADGEHGIENAGSQQRNHHDDHNQPGKGHHHIDQAHDDPVGRAAVVAGDRAEHDRDALGDDHSDQSDAQRHATAIDQPAQDIASIRVGAQPVLGAGALSIPLQVLLLVFIRRDEIGADRGQREDQNEDRAGNGQAVLLEPAPGAPSGGVDLRVGQAAADQRGPRCCDRFLLRLLR